MVLPEECEEIVGRSASGELGGGQFIATVATAADDEDGDAAGLSWLLW